MEHIILYSHGFAVDKTDRGLFTAIANAIPEAEHLMFEYDTKDKAGNTVAESFASRKDKLLIKYRELRQKHPNATIDLICHSQGCLVAALAKLKGVRKTILLTPPVYLKDNNEERKRQLAKPAVHELPDGTLAVKRRDGSTTFIKQNYWDSFNMVVNSEALYDALSRVTELVAIRATADEVLGANSCDGLVNSAKVINVEGNHSFDDDARPRIAKAVRELIMKEM